MIAVLNDTNKFIDFLASNYNIRMFENTSNRSEISYIGEAFSYRGRRFVLYLVIRQGKSAIQVYEIAGNRKVCVFQKVYSTVNDKSSLSKSTSLFNFLDKNLFT